MLRNLSLAVVLLLVALVASAVLLRDWWERPLTLPAEGIVLQVEPGDSLSRLSRHLAKRGVLDHERLLNIMGRLLGADSRILRGEYRLNQGITPEGLLTLLQSGDTVRYLVTLPEGITLSDALALIQASQGIRSTLAGANDSRLLDLVAPAASAEGYFLPETYQYERGDSDFKLLSEAHRLMEEALAHAWQQRRAELPYSEPYEALIMASIIEKETGLAQERPAIGGVFVRRLELGMRLQTDPAVIYGLGDAFQGNLQRKHLNDASNAYNSYRHHGLPPGPIALPGRDALMAAVDPAPGDALYFVARGDGSHEFSATLKEHEDAVRRFQLSRRANYRSSPENK
ncbi:endolytic transglycosylase MltG [Congregibacter variabilis]|uniref:Endolytic murein transglycosylase n=1 Tax=Congregibacter variabilis TaxID=3081200 RepID=A0ABZ0I3S7_9GAMM|nr:endolytic transglycosylase MltG [Congregibacter sp. IMCC43200]